MREEQDSKTNTLQTDKPCPDGNACRPELDAFMRSGRYLPEVLRDFHDQKEVFKRIARLEPPKGYPMPDWVTAHVYVVDHFLWFMGQHGYVLQRSHSKVPFKNLGETMKRFRDQSMESFKSIILGAQSPKP